MQAHARRISQVLSSEAESDGGLEADLMHLEAENASLDMAQRDWTAGQEPAESRGLLQADSLRGQQVRDWYAQQLLQPEWMIDVPPDLATNWCVP